MRNLTPFRALKYPSGRLSVNRPADGVYIPGLPLRIEPTEYEGRDLPERGVRRTLGAQRLPDGYFNARPGRWIPIGAGGLGLLLAALPAQAQSGGFPFTPQSASTTAPRVDALFDTLLALSALIAGTICLLILIFCFKYRRGSRANRSNPPSRNLKLEVAWILIPILLSIGVFAWAARVYFDMYQAPPGALEIFVVGKQWMWKLQHPEGQREINELHVPVGRPVKLTMTSQDVIHSFFVPAFRIKQDVVPGRYTSTWFQATRPGVYHLFCTQYCGADHASMGGWVYVMPQADYEKWLSQGNQQPTLAEAGGKLFQQLGCSGCHFESPTIHAPSLAGLYGKPVPIKNGRATLLVTADDRYIHDSILLPDSQIVAGYDNIMPSYKGQVTEEQVLQLIAFIKSLGENNAWAQTRRLPPGQNPTKQPAVEQQRQSVKERQQQNRKQLQGGAKP